MDFLEKGIQERNILLPSFMCSTALKNIRIIFLEVAIRVLKWKVGKLNLFRVVALRQGKKFKYLNVAVCNTTLKKK